MPNRLAKATSPYLLQHQHNPVDFPADYLERQSADLLDGYSIGNGRRRVDYGPLAGFNRFKG